VIGPGRYEKEAEAILVSEEAHAVLLLVVGGKRNGGMSLSQTFNSPDWDVAAAAGFIFRLPQLLRDLASQIDGDLHPPRL
jgi:hypothetical protein